MAEIELAAVGEQMGRIRPTYGYYRQSNGWITASPATDQDELKYRREGWEPLPQYGRFDMGTAYAADHPLEALFMLGGARELCLEQIVESGFHLNPPVIPTCGKPPTQYHKRHTAICMARAKPVLFPQLDGQELQSYQCRFCDRPPFPSERARGQHESVMHKDEKSDIRTGQTLADALIKGLKGSATPLTSEDKPYVCGICGQGYSSVVQSARCVKRHRAESNG